MGNSLHRKFVNFTNERLTHRKMVRKDGRYYLSEIMCEWVWGTEGHDIYKWAKDKEIITDEDHRSVIDIIRLCKKLRKHRGDVEFTKEERERYLIFINFRRKRKIGNYTIYQAAHRDKIYEYLVISE
jgi:hypothetical protein